MLLGSSHIYKFQSTTIAQDLRKWENVSPVLAVLLTDNPKALCLTVCVFLQ